MRCKIIKEAFFLTLLTCIVSAAYSQDYSAAFAAADTTNFSPNRQAGWQLFNSYAAITNSDSANLQVIILHANNIDWKAEQMIGRVRTQSLQPATQQILGFNLLYDVYQLRIDSAGNCYLKFVSGDGPSSDPMIIPLQVFYQLNGKQ
jgi:hypothetical protein